MTDHREDDEAGAQVETDVDREGGPLFDYSSALTLRPREPFLEWLRTIDPGRPEPIGARDPVVVLVPEFLRAADADAWLREHGTEIFEFELAAWSEDQATWPADRSIDTLTSWFEVGFSPTVIDCTHIGVPPIECPPLSLRQLVEELADVPEGTGLFVDTRTGGLLLLTDEQLDAAQLDGAIDPAQPEGWRAVVEAAREGLRDGHYIEVENPFLLDDLDLMQAFADNAAAPSSVRNRLGDALRSKKGRRRFMDVVHRSNLDGQWDAFVDEAAAETMRGWLEAVGLPYTDDWE